MNERTTFYELTIGEWFLFNDNLYMKESDYCAIDLIFTIPIFGDNNYISFARVAFQKGEFVTPVSKEDVLNEIRLY